MSAPRLSQLVKTTAEDKWQNLWLLLCGQTRYFCFPLLLGAVFPSYGNTIFSTLSKLLKSLQTPLPPRCTHQLIWFPRTEPTRQGLQSLAIFSPILASLLADGKLNSPLFVVSKGGSICSQTKGQAHTTDSPFLGFVPFEQRSPVDNVLTPTPAVTHLSIVMHKCPHMLGSFWAWTLPTCPTTNQQQGRGQPLLEVALSSLSGRVGYKKLPQKAAVGWKGRLLGCRAGTETTVCKFGPLQERGLYLLHKKA